MVGTKWRTSVLVSALVLVIGLLGGCEDEEKEECRIYVTFNAERFVLHVKLQT